MEELVYLDGGESCQLDLPTWIYNKKKTKEGTQ